MPEETNPAADLAAQYDDIEPAIAQPASAEAPVEPAINKAGRPYDPATGQILPNSSLPNTPQIAPYLLRMADHFGIPTEGRSEEALATAIETAQQMTLRNQAQAAEAQARGVIPSNRPELPQPEPDPLPEWTDEQYEPKFTGPLKKVLQQQAKKIKELEARLDQESSARANETAAQKLDRAILALGDARYGKGAFEDCSAKEQKLRVYLAQAAKIAAGAGADFPKVLKSISAAHQDLFGEAPTNQPVRRASAPTPADFAQGAVGKPTHRAGATEPPGFQKAVNSVEAMQHEWKANGQLSPDNMDDEFPE